MVNNLDLPYSQIQRTLKEEKFKPYKIHISQTLQPGDELRRLDFCQWLLGKIAENGNFLENIIWTDECRFTNCGFFNRHNEHYWARENPRVNIQVRPQHRFGFNVWVGLWKDRILGPYIFEETLNARRYLNFLNHEMLNYFTNVPLNELQNLWWQQRCPLHNAHIVATRLHTLFPNKWIGTRGVIAWPARSPDLNPLDFFLWGALKNNIYRNNFEHVDDLKNCLTQALRDIPRRTIYRAINNTKRRLTRCINEQGFLFEHLL